jgi:hypothetical protein
MWHPAGERIPDPPSCGRIADVLGADVDLRLTLAGHRPNVEELDPDDPIALLCSRMRRMKLNGERLASFDAMLDMWQRWDREKAAEGRR